MCLRFFFCLLLLGCTGATAQSLIVSGTVSNGAKAIDNVLLDVYEYNSPLQTLHSDSKGKYTCTLLKGKEYLLVFYQSGYVLQSISIYDSKLNKSTQQNIPIHLEPDLHSPDGLYFKEPLRRIVPTVEMDNFIENKFSLSDIRPQRRADTVSVLLHRAEANQYILIANRHLNNKPLDENYSKQIVENVKAEINTFTTQLAEREQHIAQLIAEEDRHIAAAFKAQGDDQLTEIIATQKALAERLADNASYYLLTQQQQLAIARLHELDALRYLQLKKHPIDSTLYNAYTDAKAKAANARYLSMDANKKFLVYNQYQVQQYQEYIELLRYKTTIADSAKATKPTAPIPKPSKHPPTSAFAAPPPPDTLDNLSHLNTAQRTTVIKDALAEEERFKNYAEHTEIKNNLTIKTVHIADDNYEMQMDKKGNTRYLKNRKAVTKLTFDFETTRKLVDVIETLHKAAKYK